MEAYKMLFLLRDLMKSMSELGIKMDDYKYIGLCQEYNELHGTEDAAWLQGYIMRLIVKALQSDGTMFQ